MKYSLQIIDPASEVESGGQSMHVELLASKYLFAAHTKNIKYIFITDIYLYIKHIDSY